MTVRRRDVLGTMLAGAATPFIACSPSSLATRAKTAQQRNYHALIDSFRTYIPAQLMATRVAGASVAIVEGETTVWAEGFGHTDAARTQSVSDKTLFSLQSISKTYTAVITLEAIDRGWFGLDDPLVQHLPNFRALSRFSSDDHTRITLRHLLSHWSGLPHEAPIGNNYDHGTCTFQEHIDSINDVWLLTPPGNRYAYSNLGFDLLAWLLQTRVGKPYAAFAQERLFAPLGMRATTFDAAQARTAFSFARGQLDGRDVDVFIPMLGAGGLYSTARDMARFVACQLADTQTGHGRLLSETSLEAMHTPQFPVDHQSAGYGLGLFRRRAFGTLMYSHGGGGYGYDTEQRWFPEAGLGLVVLTNDGGDSGLAQTVADHLSDALLREKPGFRAADAPGVLSDRPVETTSTTELETFAGTYRAYSGMRHFAVADGALHYHVGDMNRALDFHGDGEFTMANERFRFRHDTAGNVVSADDLGSVGVDTFVLNDRPGEATGPARPEWVSLLGSYTGFAYGESVPLKIYLQNGYLYASRAGGSKLVEYRPRLFFTVWGESVQFDDVGLLYGNRRFVRDRMPDHDAKR